MKSHYVLLRKLLHELGEWCCTSTSLDWKTIETRVQHEGLEFCTITLPQFAKDLERGLARGAVDSTLFLSFKKKACLPAFLQGFTSRVFHVGTGILLDEPDPVAIYAIRQICYLMSKVELPCSDARNKAAFSKYIETDDIVRSLDITRSPHLIEEFEEISKRLWPGVLSRVDQQIYAGDIVPRHGPGATADRIRGNAKFCQNTWTHRLEELFPHGEFVFPNWRHYDAARVDIVMPEAEVPVRVISVTKTQKTPRIIAIEPLCVQYVQQGLLESFLTAIGSHDTLSVVVGFTDQDVNQSLAKLGSLNGTLATLDLSEASDRVSYQLVRSMVKQWPWVSEALDATRSRSADVPDHGIHTVNKYASMGSALCFPIEAMVFTTIIFMAIERVRKAPVVSERSIREFKHKVRVYGDDIIIPIEYVQTTVELLEAFGLVVNKDKSFWTGKFRESCGKEYYDGYDVSIVKMRRLFPTQLQHVQEIISLVSLRNQLFDVGLNDTVNWLDSQIERLIPFPYVERTSPALGRYSHMGHETHRMCPHLQRPLVRAMKVKEVLPKSNLGEDSALLKYFLKRGIEPYAKDHLRRAGRPDAVTLKLGWVPAY